MEDFSFDVEGLLTDEEAAKFFSGDSGSEENEGGNDPGLKEVPDIAVEDHENEIDHPDAEEPEQGNPEIVGKGENKVNEEDEDAGSDDGGSSPNVFYSSIASALKNDGIFSDLDDKSIQDIKGPDDFAELFEKELQSRLDERQRRIDEALRNGVPSTAVRQYENTIQYLDSISDDDLKAEGDEGDALRKQLIYNDFIMRGYTVDRAKREVEKSFKSTSDIEDAEDALAGLKAYYKQEYQGIQDEAKKAQAARIAQQRKTSEDFKKMVLDSEVVLGDQKLDTKTRQKVFDAVTKPIYKDESGRLLTAVQKYQQDNPLEFLKQLGLWYVLTDGGKNMEGFTKGKVRSEKHKAMRELERKITATSMNPDGSLRFVSGASGDNSDSDILLSDDWKVGFSK